MGQAPVACVELLVWLDLRHGFVAKLKKPTISHNTSDDNFAKTHNQPLRPVTVWMASDSSGATCLMTDAVKSRQILLEPPASQAINLFCAKVSEHRINCKVLATLQSVSIKGLRREMERQLA